MGYRSFFVHVDDTERCEQRLEVATGLCRRYAAGLAGAFLSPTREMTPFTSAMLPTSVVTHIVTDSGEAQHGAEARFRAAVERAQLRETEWTAPAGPAIDAAIRNARYSDVVILGQPAEGEPQEAFASDLVHSVLMASGRPVIVVPHSGEFPMLGERILIAWKDSRESARAVADALPLLRRAREVTVMAIATDDDMDPAAIETGITEYLARHGITPHVRHEVAEDIDAGNLLLSRAADLSIDLMVMGGYSRPRLSELVLGGVTRLMLESMTIPVLMSH